MRKYQGILFAALFCFAMLLLLAAGLITRFLSFGGAFQPRTFSAQDLSTSELLRTL